MSISGGRWPRLGLRGQRPLAIHSIHLTSLDNRQQGAAKPQSAYAYSLDRVGNRTARIGSALAPDPGLPALPVSPNLVNEQSRYNAANQLVQGGGATLSYDDNGNRLWRTRRPRRAR